MTTAMTRKTSFENKHLHCCSDYFAIIPLCSHSTMLEKNAKTRMVCATLN